MAASGRRTGKSARGKSTRGRKAKDKASDNVPPEKDTNQESSSNTTATDASQEQPQTGGKGEEKTPHDQVAARSVPKEGEGEGEGEQARVGDAKIGENEIEDQPQDLGDLDREIEDELGEPQDDPIDDDLANDLWPPKREDKLIDYYEACTFLYNKPEPDYRLRHKKIRAFHVFAGKLKVTCKLAD